MSILNELETCVSKSIGMVTNAVTVGSNLMEAAAKGSEILVHHAEYYNDMHLQHHATKTDELTTALKKQPKKVQDLIAAFKSNG